MLLGYQNSGKTVELRELINNGFCLFDFEYPIWLESHRIELERKIINHYALRQIGFETPARFKHYFQSRMIEIMPKYVRLYSTTQFKYNPIENYNMVEEGRDTTNQKDITFRSTDTKENGVDRISETPHGSIDNIDKYMSQAQKQTREGTNDEDFTGTSENTQNHSFMRKGNIGVTSTQQLIEAERKVLEFDLDTAIIGELADLFLGVY